jgi:cell wall-associated NlpC family hydrolase
MAKPKLRIIFPLIFLLFIGCARQHQKGLITPEQIPLKQKKQSQLIDALPRDLTKNRQTIVRHAIHNLGQPYRWGGQAPDTGFDCSGLVFYTHGKADLRIPRTAKAQFKKGRPVSKPAIQPGDLVFFKISEKKTALHVGIYIGTGQFIHAPGKGRKIMISSLNNLYFSQHFKGARSYL